MIYDPSKKYVKLNVSLTLSLRNMSLASNVTSLKNLVLPNVT